MLGTTRKGVLGSLGRLIMPAYFYYKFVDITRSGLLQPVLQHSGQHGYIDGEQRVSQEDQRGSYDAAG